MIHTMILACSVLLQLTAAFIALRQMWRTGKDIAWVLIALALLLMTLRRLIPLFGNFPDDTAVSSPDVIDMLGLLVSLLLVAGMAKLAPMYTATRMSEKAARESEEKYRKLFDNANDAIYLVEESTLKIVDCNVRATEMTGYQADELKRMSFADLHPTVEKTFLPQKLHQLHAHLAGSETILLHHKKKQGGYVIIEPTSGLIDIKGEQLMLIIVRDITERKRIDDRIRMFFQASENSFEAICLCDLSREVIYVNPAFGQLFGYSREEITGKKTSLFYSEESYESLQKVSQSAPGGGWTSELTGRRRDGTTFPMSVSSSRILNEDGTIIARMSTFRNITETKQAEQKMIQYTAQLRSLSDHLNTVREEERLMLAREIHDGFGSSLTGLKMDLMFLKRNMGSCCKEALSGEILAQFKSMSDLIDTTIGLMRRIVKDLRPEILDELGLAEAVRWYVAELTKKTNIRFHLTIFPKNLKTDPRRAVTLFRIMQEILTNIARHAQAGEVNIFLRKHKGWIYLLVHDNGVGISREDIENSNSLGIIGMRERALVFGGNLVIDGEKGKGTTVKVEISAT
ncbi:MAG TPA: PAS domain S-box protein [Bacteroidales bacterium]|nr:PAS domain S-box protein [Bacteroidales bacterium]HSA44302.1 PAS domain S-box protein [Bacteroidales bacterium]